MFNLIPNKKKQDVATSREDEHPLAQFRREMDELFNRFWGAGGLVPGEESQRVRWMSDLEDKENEYVLHAELPGFEPEEIDLKLSGNVLTVRAEHKDEQKQEGAASYRYSSFHESYTLPAGVVTENIDAQYRNGVLEVHLPKGEQAQTKRIAVKSG